MMIWSQKENFWSMWHPGLIPFYDTRWNKVCVFLYPQTVWIFFVYTVFILNTKSKFSSIISLIIRCTQHTWKGFSPVWTNWCLFNFDDSTNALPHSAHTWTLGPWVWRCFLIAELSRNILLHPWIWSK